MLFCLVHGKNQIDRSESPNISYNSCITFSWMSWCTPSIQRTKLEPAAVVSWPWNICRYVKLLLKTIQLYIHASNIIVSTSSLISVSVILLPFWLASIMKSKKASRFFCPEIFEKTLQYTRITMYIWQIITYQHHSRQCHQDRS